MGILLSAVIMANINKPEVQNNILDSLLSNDELSVSIIRESQTLTTNTLETTIYKTNTLYLKEKVPRRQKFRTI